MTRLSKLFVYLFALLFAFHSCSKEDKVPVGELPKTEESKVIFHSITEGYNTGTKVYSDENLKVLWNAEDRISVFLWTSALKQFIFMGDDGDNAGDFDEVSDNKQRAGEILDHIYAIYPHSNENLINYAALMTVNLPAEQTYKEHSFGIGSNTMVAVTDDNFLPFKNVCGYLKFRFYGDDINVKSISLEGNNGEKIAGKAYITPSISSAPIVEMDDAAATSITINCIEPVTLGTSSTDYTEFIFIVPPTTFENGFKVTVTDEVGATFVKSSSRSLTISRNKMESMSAMKVTPNYDNIFVEFEDANFKAYCVENFDTNGDGEISYAEAERITRISVFTNNPVITSLKGIECFKNLTYLKCTGRGTYATEIGKLTELDLSHNTKLDTLYCGSNQIKQLDLKGCTSLTRFTCNYSHLEVLDASGCTALLSIECHDNPLKQLNASGCIALKYIDCYYNELIELNVSGCISLVSLPCFENQLTQLDVSDCVALKTLQCNDNKLILLNVSGCLALTTLECYNNQLSELDVSHNKSLDWFYCHNNKLTQINLEGFDRLTRLYCHSNRLEQLNLSGCVALNRLEAHSNQLTQLDVSDSPSLKYIDCYSNKLTYLNISQNKYLSELKAWPQIGTLERLRKKSEQSITYLSADGETIDPSDYGTEIIES